MEERREGEIAINSMEEGREGGLEVEMDLSVGVVFKYCHGEQGNAGGSAHFFWDRANKVLTNDVLWMDEDVIEGGAEEKGWGVFFLEEDSDNTKCQKIDRANKSPSTPSLHLAM